MFSVVVAAAVCTPVFSVILLFVLVLDRQCGHLQGLAVWLGSSLLAICAQLFYFGHFDGFFIVSALSLSAEASPELTVSMKSKVTLG